MKSTVALLALSTLVFVGCNKQDDAMNDSARAEKDQIEQSKDAQQDALNQQKKSVEDSADQQKDQIGAQARAEKQRVEAQSDSEKAQIEAEKKQIEAQAAAAKAEVTAQQKIDEAAGAANPSTPSISVEANATTDQSASDADRSLTQKIRESIMTTLGQDNTAAATSINVSVKDGKVTLKGSVKNEGEKKNLEAQAKAMGGVTSVDNQLEVKAE